MDNVHNLHHDDRDDNRADDRSEAPDGAEDATTEPQGIVYVPSERVGSQQDTTGPDGSDDAGGADAGEVVEGEILTEEESAELDRRLANRGALVRRAMSGTQVATRVVVNVSTHDRTKTVSKAVLRESFTVVQGVESWTKRAWDASTMGVYRRQIKAAEAVGDREELKEWTDRKEMATERRHRRMMDLPKLAWGIVKVGLALTVGLPLFVFVIAIMTKATGHGSFKGVWLGFFALLGLVIAVAA